MNNFFNDPKFQAELKQDVARAREHITGRKTFDKLAAGDSFLFAESYDLPVRWVCILPHVDNPSLWYFVAADEYSETGTCDIQLPESHLWSPLTLRCSVGFWAHCDDLNANDYLGRLEDESIEDARNRLSEMIVGQVPITVHGQIAEASEDYREWIAELAAFAEQIEARLQAEPVVLAKVDFDSAWLHHSLVAEKRTDYVALAADAVGPQEPVKPALAQILPSKLAGVLLLLRDGSEFDLVYYPAVDEQPPRLMFANGADVRAGQWHRGADGVWTWSIPLASSHGRLELTVGAESFVVPIS